jgi:hypothetical protein
MNEPTRRERAERLVATPTWTLEPGQINNQEARR